MVIKGMGTGNNGKIFLTVNSCSDDLPGCLPAAIVITTDIGLIVHIIYVQIAADHLDPAVDHGVQFFADLPVADRSYYQPVNAAVPQYFQLIKLPLRIIAAYFPNFNIDPEITQIFLCILDPIQNFIEKGIAETVDHNTQPDRFAMGCQGFRDRIGFIAEI